jgi:RNA methyltransferase, TrmH family
MIEIKSLQNPRIKHLIKLKEKRQRKATKQYTIEGYREVIRANIGNIEILSLYICPSFFLGKNEKDLLEKFESQNIEIIKCSENVFKKISYRDRPDGLVALAKQKVLDIHDLELFLNEHKNPFLLIVESVEKPGNLGTILRSCDGAGVDGIIICDEVTDIFNPNVVRASIGTLFTQKIFISTSSKIIELLQNKNVSIITTSPQAKKNYFSANYKESIAIAVGSEQYGLSEKWLELKSEKIKIPMHGVADSLNVATATTIVLYEANRQRFLK